MRRLLGRDERRASSICCSICRPARSTAARGRNCATCSPAQVVTVAVTVDEHRPAAAAPLARALSDLRQRRHRRRSRSPISTRAGTIWRSSCRSARRATSPARPSSTTACCRWCIPTAWSTRPSFAKLPLVEPVYPLTEGLALNQVRKAIDGALAKLAGSAGMAGRGLARARALSRLRRRAAHVCIARPSPPTSLPESPAWTRLAYDELLAGQLALALVRAHHAPASRPRQRRRRPPARASIIAALPYSLTQSQQQRGRRHRRRPRAAAAHAAAAARRRRLRQDRGRAARRRRRDRGRPAGRADGADRNPRAPASRHHRAARRKPPASASPSSPAASAAASATKSSTGSRSARSISWSAPMRCSRTRSRSATSRSPSSTSSTASACISAWRWRARARPSTCW